MALLPRVLLQSKNCFLQLMDLQHELEPADFNNPWPGHKSLENGFQEMVTSKILRRKYSYRDSGNSFNIG